MPRLAVYALVVCLLAVAAAVVSFVEGSVLIGVVWILLAGLSSNMTWYYVRRGRAGELSRGFPPRWGRPRRLSSSGWLPAPPLRPAAPPPDCGRSNVRAAAPRLAEAAPAQLRAQQRAGAAPRPAAGSRAAGRHGWAQRPRPSAARASTPWGAGTRVPVQRR